MPIVYARCLGAARGKTGSLLIRCSSAAPGRKHACQSFLEVRSDVHCCRRRRPFVCLGRTPTSTSPSSLNAFSPMGPPPAGPSRTSQSGPSQPIPSRGVEHHFGIRSLPSAGLAHWPSTGGRRSHPAPVPCPSPPSRQAKAHPGASCTPSVHNLTSPFPCPWHPRVASFRLGGWGCERWRTQPCGGRPGHPRGPTRYLPPQRPDDFRQRRPRWRCTEGLPRAAVRPGLSPYAASPCR